MNRTLNPNHLFMVLIVAGSLSACSSTVDLDQPSLKESAVPTCAVAARDYKLLTYWNKRTEDKKYGKIIAALEKKYQGAPKVGDTSAVVAAQSYVRQNGDVGPLDMERKVEGFCAKATK